MPQQQTSRQLVEENEKLRRRVEQLERDAKELIDLRESQKDRESRLRQIIDLVPHMVFVKDLNGRLLLANQALADAYGTTVEALLGRSHSELHSDEEELRRMLSDDLQVIRSGKSKLIPEETFIDAQGRRRILQTTKVPYSVPGSGEKAVLGVAVDITELKHEKTLQDCRSKALDRLGSGASLKQVLETLVEAVEESHPGLLACVLLLDEERRHLLNSAAPSLPEFYNEAIQGLEIGPDVGSCGASAATARRVIAEDVMTHPNWEPYRDLAQKAGLRACWSEPILSAAGEVLGTFALYSREPRSPEDAEIQFIHSMAHLAGIAIERKRTDDALRESEQRYRTLVENAPEAIVVLDVDENRFVDANENAVSLFQMEREELFRRGPAELGPATQPGGPSSRELAERYVQDALAGGSPTFEWIHRDSTGIDIPCEVRLVRFPSSTRKLLRGSITNISERKREEEHQQLMLQELDHRVKNILATVQAIGEQTLESSPTQFAFATAFKGRIASLARAHEALAQRKWEGASLLKLVERTVAPYRGEEERRVSIQGEEFVLPFRTVQPISMALHELATNAAKYGALSVPEGKIDISWYLRNDPKGRRLHISWIEKDGPPVSEPAERNVGLALIERGIGYELGGLVKLDFQRSGFRCEISFAV